MFKRRWLWISVLVLFAFISTLTCWWYWDAWSIPDYPDQLTLYSIDGGDYKKGQEPKTLEKFHRFPLLGKVEITDPVERHKIMSALRQGIAENWGSGAHCFWPRHVIRIVVGQRTIEYVICFECGHVYVTENGKRKILHTTDSPLPLFNKALEDAGVKLAPWHIDRVKKENEG